MDSTPADWGMGASADEDLEYDLAHEAIYEAASASAHEPGITTDEADPEQENLTYVATETPEYSGDLSYDLSHDVPGR